MKQPVFQTLLPTPQVKVIRSPGKSSTHGFPLWVPSMAPGSRVPCKEFQVESYFSSMPLWTHSLKTNQKYYLTSMNFRYILYMTMDVEIKMLKLFRIQDIISYQIVQQSWFYGKYLSQIEILQRQIKSQFTTHGSQSQFLLEL